MSQAPPLFKFEKRHIYIYDVFHILKGGCPPVGSAGGVKKYFTPPHPGLASPKKVGNLYFQTRSFKFRHRRATVGHPQGQCTHTQYRMLAQNRYTDDFDQKKALFSDFGP